MTPSSAAPRQDRRYLRVVNKSTERITVYLQCYTKDEDGNWLWYPGDPAESAKAKSFEIEPGKQIDVSIDGWRVNASDARIWAKSTSGLEWNKYKDENLPLVTERDDEGNRVYFAEEMQTFTFTIR